MHYCSGSLMRTACLCTSSSTAPGSACNCTAVLLNAISMSALSASHAQFEHPYQLIVCSLSLYGLISSLCHPSIRLFRLELQLAKDLLCFLFVISKLLGEGSFFLSECTEGLKCVCCIVLRNVEGRGKLLLVRGMRSGKAFSGMASRVRIVQTLPHMLLQELVGNADLVRLGHPFW